MADLALQDPALSLFQLLEYLPGHPYVATIVVVICFILFLTPVGSGTLMVANLSTQGGTNDQDSPIWLRIFWSVVITLVSMGLLLAGSFNAMQSAVVLCGLPFSVVILLYVFGLYQSLQQDQMFNAQAVDEPVREIKAEMASQPINPPIASHKPKDEPV